VGDGTACKDRHRSAYLYDFGHTRLLLDCGEPVSRSLKMAGVSASDVDHILLSHLHSDHVGGLFMLLQGFWLDRREKHLTVHLPAGGIASIHEMLRTVMLFDELLPFRLNLQPLRIAEPMAASKVRVTPFATTHLEALRRAFEAKYPVDFSAHSFLMETGPLRVAHSADLGTPEDLEPLLTGSLDLLVCELAHFEPEALFRYLKGRPIKRFVFTHLGQSIWEKLAATRRLARKILGPIPICFPRDLQVIRL
jgi:hypothetical protein